MRWKFNFRPRALSDLDGATGAYRITPYTVPSHPPFSPYFMPRSQRPKKEKGTPTGKAATLHSFFGSAIQSEPIRTPSKPTEIIIIDSGDEDTETSPTQSKRKALNDPDTTGSSGSKRGKLSRNTVRLAPENDSPLKSVPSSSLNRTIGTVEGDMYAQTSQTQQAITIIGDWEMGDDEFLDLFDDSQTLGDEDGGSENTLDTCPVCGAIFVDFCLSVSVTPPPLIGPCSSRSYSATSSARQCLYRRWSVNESVT